MSDIDKMTACLRAGERLDDLCAGGLKLIQRQDFFCLGEDSVLLADFAHISADDKVLELGCGNGGVLLLLHAKAPAAQLHGVEIMPACADLAKRNVRLNGLDKQIEIFCADARSFAPPTSNKALYDKYDKIVCNPPYAPAGSGRLSPVAERSAAIFQLHGDLADFIKTSARLLKPEGRAFFVLPASSAEQGVEAAAGCGLKLIKSETRREKRRPGKAITLLEFHKP